MRVEQTLPEKKEKQSLAKRKKASHVLGSSGTLLASKTNA